MTRFTPSPAILLGCLLAAGAAVATSGCLVPAKVGTVESDATSSRKTDAKELSAAKITAEGLVDLAQLPEAQSETIRLPDPSVATDNSASESGRLPGPLPEDFALGSRPIDDPPEPVAVRLGPPLFDVYSTKELFHFEAMIRDELPRRQVEVVAAPINPLMTAQIQPVPPPAPLPTYQGVEQLPPQAMPIAPRSAMPLATNEQPGVGGPMSVNGQLSTVQRFKPIQQISLDIAPPAVFDGTQPQLPPPTNYAAEALPLLAQQRPFTRGEILDYGYELRPDMPALNFCYQPLYFEEVNVERYGRSFGVFQPAVSAAHFYSGIYLLPYRVFAQPARRCTYHAHWTLPGYRLSGKEHQRMTASLAGGAAHTGFVYALVLLIP